MTSFSPQPSDLAPPPELQDSPLNWIKKNLFSPWYNGMITVVILGILAYFAYHLVVWSFTEAKWDVIPRNFQLFMVGRYPKAEYWRLWILLGLICSLAGLSWGAIARNVAKLYSRNILIGIGGAVVVCLLMPVPLPNRWLLIGMTGLVVGLSWVGQQVGRKNPKFGTWVSSTWILLFFIALWLIGGGLSLKPISSNEWQGLMLTVFMAVVSIFLSFPLGVLLALGRRSPLPIFKGLSIAYIELVRGVPLITILFMGQVMVPLFLPEGIRPDRVVRAIVGLTLFSTAYLAENVRGGLQSVPRGQVEAARALGLNTPFTLLLVVLPQALKAVIPAIVGQFIGLFQDTTLLAIVGLVELLGISNSVLANPTFLGRFSEVYLFNALLFWFFCYVMSAVSRWVERKVNVDYR